MKGSLHPEDVAPTVSSIRIRDSTGTELSDALKLCQ